MVFSTIDCLKGKSKENKLTEEQFMEVATDYRDDNYYKNKHPFGIGV